MKFVVSSTDLLTRLQVIVRVASNKSSLPILDNFLFDVKGNNLTITASDTEVTMVTTMQLDNVDEEGRLAVPSHKLLEYLKKLPEQPITFYINKETYAIEIESSAGKNSQAGLDAQEYPEVPAIDASEARTLNISNEALLSAINKTSFATNTDELRPTLRGILFDITPDNTTFVATDSHKLVRYIRNDVKADFTSSFILNKKPAVILKSILPKNDELVRIDFDSKNAVFTNEFYTVFCRLVEGTFPSYTSVIPTDNPYKLVVNRADLLNTVSRVSLFADGSALVKMEMTENNIAVSSQDLDFSCSAVENVGCQYMGEPISIGFKSPFLVDILSNMTATEVIIELSDPSRAGLIVPFEKNDNEDELMLLMPMKI